MLLKHVQTQVDKYSRRCVNVLDALNTIAQQLKEKDVMHFHFFNYAAI